MLQQTSLYFIVILCGKTQSSSSLWSGGKRIYSFKYSLQIDSSEKCGRNQAAHHPSLKLQLQLFWGLSLQALQNWHFANSSLQSNSNWCRQGESLVTLLNVFKRQSCTPSYISLLFFKFLSLFLSSFLCILCLNSVLLQNLVENLLGLVNWCCIYTCTY